MSKAFGKKLERGFQSVGKKVGIGANFGRKVTGSVDKIDKKIQRYGTIAMMMEPELAPAIGGVMGLSHLSNAAVQSGSALAKKKGDNSAQLERFAADYGQARGGYTALRKNGLERPQQIRAPEDQLFA